LVFNDASADWQLPVDPLLEREYSLRLRHPERTEIYARQAQASAALRNAMQGLRTIRYDTSPGCLLDFLPATQPLAQAAPLFIFIHGGYWRALNRGIFTFLAKPWLDRGVHAAFIGYDLAPAVSVSRIAEQGKQAIVWLCDHAQELGVDTARILLAGHSAGAHLGACVLNSQQGWQAAGFLGISGVYDLEPLRHTSVNADLRLDAQEAHFVSPMRHVAKRATRHLLAVGGAETDGFRSQSLNFTDQLRHQGCVAQSLIVTGCTHFNILDELGNQHSSLFHQAYALLGIE
jgi:arylformamidase